MVMSRDYQHRVITIVFLSLLGRSSQHAMVVVLLELLCIWWGKSSGNSLLQTLKFWQGEV